MTGHSPRPSARAESPRQKFVTYLYRVHRSLDGTNKHAAADSRAVLARLRRSFAGQRQQADGYLIVFDFDPPEDEQQVWLLTGGLFALHPRPSPAGPERGRSVGAALGTLARENNVAAERRFRQLIAVEGDGLAYYLRQAVQLLRAGSAGLDYYRLINDLAVLLAADPSGRRAERRQDIRVAWIRDFSHSSRQQATS
jgi:CRISPR system Cascade subunit CasB